MNADDVKSLNSGDILVYDDGRPGHSGVKAVVLSNGRDSLVVQFEDRAQTTTIKHSDTGWTQHLKLGVLPKATYERGDYVKVEIPDETTGVGEWVWVRVHRCDYENRLVFGVLDNEPLNDYGDNLRLGSELAIAFDKIREHRKSSGFGPAN